MSLLFTFYFLLLIFLVKFFKTVLNVLIVFGLNLWFFFFHFWEKWFYSFTFLWKLLIFPILLFLKVLQYNKWAIGNFTSRNFLSISFDLIRSKITKLKFHRFDFLIQLIFYSFDFSIIILLLLDDYLISNYFIHYSILSWGHKRFYVILLRRIRLLKHYSEIIDLVIR